MLNNNNNNGHRYLFKILVFGIFVCLNLSFFKVLATTNLYSVSVRKTLDSGSGNTGYASSITLGIDGFPRVAHVDSGDTDSLYLNVCQDTSCNDFDKTLIDEDSNYYISSSIQIGEDGFARIAYPSADQYLKFARCTDNLCSEPNIITVDSGVYIDSMYGISMKIASDGYPRIAYEDSDTNTLKYIICEDANCTTKTIVTISSEDEAYFSMDMVLDNNDTPYFAFQGSENTDLKYTRCSDAMCSSINTSSIQSDELTAYGVQFVLGSDGFPRFVFGNSDQETLKFLRCLDNTCSTTTEKTFIEPDVWTKNLIALRSNDIPVIAFSDDASDSLKFIQCLDADCSDYETIDIDSAATDTGNGKGMVLDSNESVYIVYNNADDSSLEFVRLDIGSQAEENETSEDFIIKNVFKEDTKCHYTKPNDTTWVKIENTENNGVKGINLVWTQYDANKIDILIDDGTGTYPWKVSNTENDGHEFLPNVFSWQNIKIKPINHCRSGNYGIPISQNAYPYGWYNISK